MVARTTESVSGDASRVVATFQSTEAVVAFLLGRFDDWQLYAKRHMPRRLRSLCEPEDVLQEAFIRARESIELLVGKSEDEAIAWFLAVVRSTAKDQDRYHGRGKRSPPERVVANWIPSPELPPDDLLAMKEAVERLAIAIQALPPELSLPFLLVRLYDITVGEVAKQLGLSSKVISERIYRARRRLRKDLKHPNGSA